MKSQDKILIFLHDRIRRGLYPPTVREIGDGVGLKSTSTVHAHLHVLKEKEYVDFEEKKPRTIIVTSKGLNRIWELNGRR